MIIDILMILAGLALLFIGGEGLIKGAVALARHFGLSKILVSAVIIGFGTSMPEITVSLNAALKGAPDIVIGNVVGSNIANILLIIGIAALISPLAVPVSAVRRDVIVTLGVSALLCALGLLGIVHSWAGALMVIALAAYIFWSYHQDKNQVSERPAHLQEDIEGRKPITPLKAGIFTLGGLAFIVAGAHWMVEGAVSIARDFGIAEATIGLTIVAIGTSLPELATALVAAMRKHSDVIIGNILGSSIFNVLAILGLTAMVSPIAVAPQVAAYDVWILLGVAGFMAIYLLRGLPFGRLTGGLMLTSYALYILWLYTGGAV